MGNSVAEAMVSSVSLAVVDHSLSRSSATVIDRNDNPRSLNSPKTPSPLKAIDDSTEPDRAQQEPGITEETHKGFGLAWSAGGAIDGLDDHLCDRIWIYP
jgi:hypothetical protein